MTAPNYTGYDLGPQVLHAIETFVTALNILGVGGGNFVGATPTSYTSIIKMDLEAGRDYGSHTVSTAEVFSVDPASVENGTATVTLKPGGGSIDITAFQNPQAFVYDNTRTAVLTFWFRDSTAYVFGVLGPASVVVLPTLLSAVVPNATPNRINFTWSTPMNSDVSAAAAFAVSSGHPLTSHAYDDSTHSHAITSTPFVAGEGAKTAAYTQPGSSKMRDLAGNLVANFSGVAITNQVAAPASLTIADGVSQGDFNISALANMDEYIVFNNNLPQFAGSKVASIFQDMTMSYYGGAAKNNNIGVETISWTDSQAGNGGNPTGNNQFGQGFGVGEVTDASGPGEAGVTLDHIHVSPNVEFFRVFGRAVNWSGNMGAKLRATLADASAGPVIGNPYSNGDTNFYFNIRVNSSGPTDMKLDWFPATQSVGAQVSLIAIAAYH